MMLLVLLELVLVVYIYGLRHYLADLRWMMGAPASPLGRVFGPSGYWVSID
jgi:hypothetical protein